MVIRAAHRDIAKKETIGTSMSSLWMLHLVVKRVGKSWVRLDSCRANLVWWHQIAIMMYGNCLKDVFDRSNKCQLLNWTYRGWEPAPIWMCSSLLRRMASLGVWDGTDLKQGVWSLMNEQDKLVIQINIPAKNSARFAQMVEEQTDRRENVWLDLGVALQAVWSFRDLFASGEAPWLYCIVLGLRLD